MKEDKGSLTFKKHVRWRVKYNAWRRSPHPKRLGRSAGELFGPLETRRGRRRR